MAQVVNQGSEFYNAYYTNAQGDFPARNLTTTGIANFAGGTEVDLPARVLGAGGFAAHAGTTAATTLTTATWTPIGPLSLTGNDFLGLPNGVSSQLTTNATEITVSGTNFVLTPPLAEVDATIIVSYFVADPTTAPAAGTVIGCKLHETVANIDYGIDTRVWATQTVASTTVGTRGSFVWSGSLASGTRTFQIQGFGDPNLTMQATITLIYNPMAGH